MTDDDETQRIILLDEVQLARGTRTVKPLPPALVTGDWMVSPTGAVGYIAGRSQENPELWLFVVKNDNSNWGSIVEMSADSFIGFKLKEKDKACDDSV